MSDSFLVFLEKENIPTVNELIKLAKQKGLVLESWEDEGIDSLVDIEGFWPGDINGSEAGFEFFMGEIDSGDLENWEVDKSQLPSQTLVAELVFYTELDIKASAIVVSILCKQCNGITFDDNDDLSVGKNNCENWLLAFL